MGVVLDRFVRSSINGKSSSNSDSGGDSEFCVLKSAFDCGKQCYYVYNISL